MKEQHDVVQGTLALMVLNRRARFYRHTATGRKQLHAGTRDWNQTAAIIARFFEVKAEDLP